MSNQRSVTSSEDRNSARMKVRHGIERLLLAGGVVLMLAYAAATIHSQVMYRAGMWTFRTLNSGSQAVSPDRNHSGAVDFSLWSSQRVEAYGRAVARRLGAPIAMLSVPRLALRVPVFEGTDELTLNRGVGRIEGTEKFGGEGNVGIAGHRDGFFRSLKDVRLGDRIELGLARQKLVYTVDRITVVSPRDVTVLRARSNPSVTLVTCYPFYFVGGAPQRYIVQASLVNSNSELTEVRKEKRQ